MNDGGEGELSIVGEAAAVSLQLFSDEDLIVACFVSQKLRSVSRCQFLRRIVPDLGFYGDILIVVLIQFNQYKQGMSAIKQIIRGII